MLKTIKMLFYIQSILCTTAYCVYFNNIFNTLTVCKEYVHILEEVTSFYKDNTYC